MRLQIDRQGQAEHRAVVAIFGAQASAGFMTLLELGDDLDDALQRADQALYRAKRDGRNRCAAAWENVDA